jgi:hypothetical protein
MSAPLILSSQSLSRLYKVVILGQSMEGQLPLALRNSALTLLTTREPGMPDLKCTHCLPDNEHSLDSQHSRWR